MIHINLNELEFKMFNQSFELLGGAKVWECTETVGEYLTKVDNKKSLIDDFKGKTVLDLGCGAGILGILALQNGASVHFQDYVLSPFNRH